MTISVIIPIYNVSQYLNECVNSVLSQSYKDIEVILVDDGSTDDSGILCEQIGKENKTIKVIHKENGGLSDTRNVGLQHAIGDYILFLDADDYYSSETLLSSLVDELSKNSLPDILLFCRKDFYEDIKTIDLEKPYDIERINSTDNTIDIFRYLLEIQRFNMSACFQIIKRSVLVDNNIYFEKGLRNEDIDWSINLWRHINSVKAVNIYGYVYRHRSNSITTTLSVKDILSYKYMFDKWLGLLDAKNDVDLPYLQYLAFIFPTMLYYFYDIPRSERRQAYELINSMSGILQYSNTKKAERVSKVKKILGMKLTTLIFGIYGSYLKPIIRRIKR